MDKESSSKEPKYTRGKYKTYRRKYQSKQETSLQEAKSLLRDLEEFREKINSHETSQYKSKILENIQGLIDCIRKYEQRIEDKQKENYELIIESLEKRVKHLEEVISFESILESL